MPRKKLVDGFNRFRNKYYKDGPKDGEGLMNKLAREGAWPDFFIVNCIDPRNGADIVFDALPGQQFIHSQMGAIITPYDAARQPELNASLSYAIDNKKIKHLLIIGHSQCGGVQALVNKTSDHYIEDWVKMAADAECIAEKKVGAADTAALQHETERQVIIMSLKNVMEYPMVKKALQEGRLTVDGWLFDLEKGALLEYRPDKNAFEQISAAPVQKRPPHRPPPGMAA